MSDEKKIETLSFKTSSSTKEELLKLCKKDDRKPSYMLDKILTEYLKSRRTSERR